MREDEWPNAAIFVCTRRVNTRVICQKIKRDVIQMTAETIAGRSSLNNVSKYIHIYLYIYIYIHTHVFKYALVPIFLRKSEFHISNRYHLSF